MRTCLSYRLKETTTSKFSPSPKINSLSFYLLHNRIFSVFLSIVVVQVAKNKILWGQCFGEGTVQSLIITIFEFKKKFVFFI